MRVLTNNLLAKQKLANVASCQVSYFDCSLPQLLVHVRDQVHLGYRLCTHPLSGSVKPNHTPYKSIGMSDTPQPALCVDSLLLIEQAIAVCRQLGTAAVPGQAQRRHDFQLIDWTLLQSALPPAMPPPDWRAQVPAVVLPV